MDRLKELKQNTDVSQYEICETETKYDNDVVKFNEKIEIVRMKLLEIEEVTKNISDEIRARNFESKHIENANGKIMRIMYTLKSTISKLEISEQGKQRNLDTVSMYKVRFGEIIISHRKVLEDFKKKALGKFRLNSSTMGMSDDDFVHLMEQGVKSEDLIKLEILGGTVNSLVENSTTNVKSKYDEVILLGKAVDELSKLFLDMALVVDEQGKILSSIENNVKQSGDFIDHANVDMVYSVELSQSIRAKQCCIALIILTVIGIIVTVISTQVS